MDCFIVRVYRHIAHDNDQPDEIAGLVERVGRQDSGKPFSSYQSLVSALRNEIGSGSAGGMDAPEEGVGRMRLLQGVKHR